MVPARVPFEGSRQVCEVGMGSGDSGVSGFL